jgi:ABC-2 type transport system permease protein
MWGKIKQFFSLVKYETIRIARNRVVMTMLLIFSIVLLLALSFIQEKTETYPIAMYTDGVNMEETQVVQLIEEGITFGKIIYVDSPEEGIDMIRSSSACFFICLDAGAETDETTAVFYYDQSNNTSRSVVNSLSNEKNEYAYTALANFLERWGVKLNQTYFELVSFEKVNTEEVGFKQMPFASEVACCISVILMLGLAYSLARDNETNISKNLAYIPVGVNRYLLSKVVPYFVLGVSEISVMYLIGKWFFDINFQVPILTIIALSSLFVLAVIMLGLLFSLLKSQTSTIFLDMLVVIMPIFLSIMVYVEACPMYIQVMLYALPITPFIKFLNCMMFNGMILWWIIPVFVAQIIFYYFIASLIMKKRVQD